MAKKIDITARLSNDKPSIVVAGKEYQIDSSVENMMKFSDLAELGNEGLLQALQLTLGREAVEEIGITKQTLENFKVYVIAIMAAMQGLEYEEAEKQFRKLSQEV